MLMNDIQPVRNFLTDIQGDPEFLYTRAAAAAYDQVKEKVKAVAAVNKQQGALQKQLVKKIEVLQDLIREYDREIMEATEYLGQVSPTEKKHLQVAFNKIRKTEQEVQELMGHLP
jgi:phage shock protein A